MNDIITIQNVRAYLDKNNTAWLNAEDVARGLGFTQIAASGNSVVRWERVNRYLREFCFIPTSGDGVKAGDYIPENMFYRLAMKANNAVAEIFQAKVADEILPAIRKHGVYATDNFVEKALANPDFAIRVFTELKAERVNGRTFTYLAWTQRGRYFLYNFLKERGILPVHERLQLRGA